MTIRSFSRKEPICLLVPGLNNSGPRHWQTVWEQTRPDCQRVELGSWANPHRNHWVTKLDLAIASQARPVILVAHSLGCLAVAWWAALTEPAAQTNVVGALLVAPPDVENPNARAEVRRFAPAPQTIFRFPAAVVASSDDPYATPDRARTFANRWGAQFVDIGPVGHINADSFLGEWLEGQRLLDRFLGHSTPNAGPARPKQSPERAPPYLRGH